MKSILITLCLLLTLPILAEEVELGNETIKPLGFAKTLIAYDIEFFKTFNGLSGPKNVGPMKRYPLNAQLGFDVGLHRHFNAGLIFEAFINEKPDSIAHSNLLKLSLFLKPHFPLSNRLSIFTKFRAGLLTNLGGNDYLSFNGNEKLAKDYHLRGFGATWGASLGIDYFPWSRMGFFLEWGIKSDFVFFKKQTDVEYIGYMLYNFPITLGLYVII